MAETLRNAGHEAWLVGGCVRDSLLGRIPKDWDLVTDARPDLIAAGLPPGPAFRPLLARLNDLQLEGQTSKSALLALLPSLLPTPR